jgi:hypothetical protein
MTPQLQQVAQTYLTRRSLCVVAAFAVVSWAFSLVVTSLVPNEPLAALPTVGLAAAVTGYALGIHAKWQFCNPRARLLPGFKRTHLAMLAAILIVCCVVYPLVVVQVAHWNPLGALAFSIAGTAAGIWAMHRRHILTFVPAFLVFLSFGTPSTINFYALPAPTPAVTAAHLAILAVAWGAIVYWLHRLSVVGEEDADYPVTILASDGARQLPAGKQVSYANERMLVPGSWQSRLADTTYDPVSYAPATTIAARKRLLRVGPLAMPFWLRAAGLAVMFLGMVIVAGLVGWGFGAGFGLDAHENAQMVGIITLMTAAAGGGVLGARRARMTGELMFPLRRRDYFNGLFAAAARYAFTIWLTTLAAIIAYVALFSPERFFPGYIAAATALSLGLHTCMFGALINNARLKSGAVRLVVYLTVLFAATAVLIVGDQYLPERVATDARREQLVQEQYADTYEKVKKNLPPGRQMPPEMKQKVLELAREIVSHRIDGPSGNPYVPWACAGVLTIAGVAAFLDARKRWLTLELG